MILNDEMLKQRIILHEGLETTLYKDSLGNFTIGVGHLLEPSKGGKLSVNACLYILGEDMANAHVELMPYHWYTKLDNVRAGMLVEMCFNIGLHGVLEFHDMIQSIENSDYAKAAQDFLNSAEAREIHAERADDMAYRLEHGAYKA
jgi:lysozyme